MHNIEDIYPLSPAQEAMLAATLNEPPAVSLAQMSCVLSGVLDLSAFERAWQQVMNRHAILRTSFAWKQLEKPLQVVNRQLSIAFEIHDLQSLSDEQRHERIAELQRAELEKHIDPSAPPLARVVLCGLERDSARLLFTYHPLILDERSLSVLLREVLTSYASGGNGHTPQLAPGNPFWSYVNWIKEQDVARAQAFWRESLSNFNGQTPLEEIYKQHDMSEGYDREVTELSRVSFSALEDLANRLQVKLEALTHAAWALLLNRESGDEDVVYGYAKAETPLSLSGNGAVIGPLSTTVPVRFKINPHASAISSIKSLDDQLNQIRQFGFCSLNDIRKWAALPDELSLFQSVVSDQIDEDIEVGSLKFHDIQTLGPTNAPLLVRLPRAETPQLHITHDRRLFARETIQRLSAHFVTLLEGLVANPEQPVLTLPFLTATEQAQLSVWNETTTDYPRESTIQQLFEQQAEARPNEIAVVFEAERLTYAELNERANQLAHYLRLLGIQPETRIALCVERSLEMLIGILGILKAGGAYAPIDASHPLERLSFMLDDLQAPVVLTQHHLLDKLPAHWGQVVCLDADWETISLESTANPVNVTSAESLAYVMYTSGSTGTPKGVSVSQRAVVRLVKNTNYIRLGPGEVFLQFAPISFDASTLEIWGCLLNGGRLAVMPPSLPSLDVLGEALRKHGVTTLWLTAGLFHLMVDERLSDLQSVRQLLAGGDALSLPHVKKAFEGLPSCQLINGYGPTEGTTFTCCYSVTDVAQLRASVPIGRPISNTQAFILDRHLRPVPPGVIGELYIGGDGLARDYHNRPDLTAERFVPSTQGNEPGARLYRTGDLVRYLHDGNIEFLGRRDLQVKVRGFRIELGEIEVALNTHPTLHDAVVVARADVAGEKQLVAYLVVHEGKAVSPDELRDYLKLKLPDHMIPATFITLEALPLTANGKVDRRALPAPDVNRAGLASDFIAPRSEVEELLTVIWSQALGVEQIGIDDNFFALGGDSIRSVQVLAKVQERGLTLSLQDLFQYQTIRELARVATTSRDGIERSEPTKPFDLIEERDRQRLPAAVEDAYPLTMLQAGMIFHSELNPEAGVYHDIFSHHVHAPYNPDALRTALESLVKQHAALRTCFALEGFSEPLQMVMRSVEIPLRVFDLRDLSAAEQDQFLRDHLESEKNRGFDWSRAPLLKIELHRRSSDTFQFTIGFHHAILDGWSMASLLAELFRSYFALLEQDGPPAEVKPLTGSYRDYVASELNALRSEECRRYWNDKLTGSDSGDLRQWLAREIDDKTETTVYKVSIDIAPELAKRLRELASAASVPIKSVLLAAHLKVISLLSDQSDVITGLVSNGRPEEGDGELLLGLFLNTIPFRQQLRTATSIQLVQQTFRNEWESLPYRWYPLAQMQRDQGGKELFETAFNFTHFHVARALQETSRLQILGSLSSERTNFAFFANFSLGWSTGDIHFMLDTRGDLFTAKQTKSIADYYLRVLTAMAAAPENNHEIALLLSDEERQKVLLEWNDTRRDYAADRCIHELVEVQAQLTPHAIAVECGDAKSTYAELNGRANQVAAWLRAKGVGPEARVGLAMDRSLEMIVALLGILKSGAAYVPLDRAYPKERLTFMIQDAQIELVLAQQDWSDSLPHNAGKVVWIDQQHDEIASYSTDNLAVKSTPQNLAYMIYTSGSTGQPKGVMITHSALVNYVEWAGAEFNLEASDRLLQFASLTFDVAAEEIFSTLTRGATLILRTDAMMSSAQTFLETCAALEISVLDIPTAYWHFLISEMIASDLELPETVRLVVLGGERVLPALLAQWQTRVSSNVELIDAYGPTETTIAATVGRLSDPLDLSIGRPVANTQIYMLDAQLQPVPIGVAGEICIGGTSLARGYWNQPALTAERFVPNNWSDEPGSRLYRTGDRGRYRADGKIEFLGRTDQQIKIRGFRVELGEIESCLLDHPQVRQAVVLARREQIDQVRLVAYVVADENAPEPQSLRAYLQERLPEHMVPSAFVSLAQLPLTPAGKVDRRALPAPDAEALAVSRSTLVSPRTEVEQLLQSIWSEVLKHDQFGIHDNFFALGGHSLLATQVITRMRKVFDMKAPLRALFQHPTIAELGQWIETNLRDDSTAAPALKKVSRTSPLPLSFAQQRLWFIDQLEPGSSLYNVPLAMRLHEGLDVTLLERAFAEIVRRHEVLRTHFETIDGEPVQIITPPGPFHLEVEDLSALAEEERGRVASELVHAEARAPFDLARGPLMRVRVLRLSDYEHLILLTMHHAISDGWSMELLLREVTTLYVASMRREAVSLPELEIQYGDYAVWQREWLRGAELERQMSYWRKQLQGAPEVLELPQDHPRPPVQTHNGATHRFGLGSDLSTRVRELSHETQTTTFMVLLAAWQVLLKRLSGANDICVGTVVAGRTHPQLEPLIGFFVNTLVLRASLNGDPTFAELLQQAREICLEAYSHQDVPFEKLVEELAPERNLAHAPLFQVMMVMQQQQQHESSAIASLTDGFGLSAVEPEGATAKYDLTMNLRDSGTNIGGALEYNTDIFETWRAQSMVQQWKQVLAAAVAQPERRISELPLLDEEEQQRLAIEWNQTATPYERDRTISQLFEDQVDRSPDAIALIFDGKQIDYRELNCRANQLARYLVNLGVGPEVLVGICLDRSIDMVVSLLAILKAGGGYVPLDPSYPKERLSFMVADAGVSLLLTDKSFAGLLSGSVTRTLLLDEDWPTIARESSANIETRAVAENVVYVMYTSGSTGRPKGVTVTHRNVVRLVNNTDYARLSPDEVFLHFAPISFDASTFEVWGSLLNGGRLAIVPSGMASLDELVESLDRYHVTTLWLTAGLFHLLVDQGVERLRGVRQLLAGGEALSVTHVKQVLEQLEPGAQLINGYGPTEGTTFTCCYAMDQHTEIEATVPIGRPIANTEVYILDEYGQVAPVGIPGELYIGGDGLARGYWAGPELTAERFVPDALSGRSGGRLYRTGDLVRYRPDGQIEFIGRLDQQVKLRGFRIELGEVETILTEHHSVREAVVIRPEGADSLSAYVVSDDPELTGAELRLYIKDRLPDYMVPSTFTLLDNLPLTPNGKVDRRALQQGEYDAAAPRDTFVAPRDLLEFRLSQIWEDVLAVKPMGVTNNFFELGGHSFLAVRLMGQIKEQTGVSLPLALLMQGGTIEALASELRQHTPSSHSPLVAIKREGTATPFFCVRPAGGNVLCYAPLARHLGPERPFYAFQAPGLEDGEEPLTSTEAMAACYIDLMRTIQPDGPYLLGGWSSGGLIAYEMSRMLEQQGQRTAALALIDTYLIHRGHEEDDEAALLIRSALHMGLTSEHLSALHASMIALEPQAKLDFALDHLRGLKVLPPDWDYSQTRRLINVLKANLRAARNYRPQPSDVKITFFKAKEEPGVDPVAPWIPLARQGVTVREIFTDHFAMMREPDVVVLADQLNQCLKDAEGSQDRNGRSQYRNAVASGDLRA